MIMTVITMIIMIIMIKIIMMMMIILIIIIIIIIITIIIIIKIAMILLKNWLKTLKVSIYLLPVKYLSITWLVTETNGLHQRKKNFSYFFTKIPNLNLYENQNDKSIFRNCIDRFGPQKRETKQQQTNKEKPMKK